MFTTEGTEGELGDSKSEPPVTQWFAVRMSQAFARSSTSTARTRELAWKPTHAGLLADIAEGHYFAAPRAQSA